MNTYANNQTICATGRFNRYGDIVTLKRKACQLAKALALLALMIPAFALVAATPR